MEILLVILIVLMTVQTALFTYTNFVDLSHSRERIASMEMMKGAQANFMDEKAQFKRVIEARDETLRFWKDRADRLDLELAEARKVNGLLKNRTFHIEGMKDSFNRQAEGEWDLFEAEAEALDLSRRQCFAEGMRRGAEWVCQAVGVHVGLELDGRFDEAPGPDAGNENENGNN